MIIGVLCIFDVGLAMKIAVKSAFHLFLFLFLGVRLTGKMSYFFRKWPSERVFRLWCVFVHPSVKYPLRLKFLHVVIRSFGVWICGDMPNIA